MNSFQQTLSDALVKLGCDPAIFHFDDRSLIAMDFTDIGDLLMDPVDGHIWMWGDMPDVSFDTLRHGAYDLLSIIVVPVPYFDGAAMGVRSHGERVRVGGKLTEMCSTDVGELASAIEDFHARVRSLHEASR